MHLNISSTVNLEPFVSTSLAVVCLYTYIYNQKSHISLEEDNLLCKNYDLYMMLISIKTLVYVLIQVPRMEAELVPSSEI